jgi:tetratricopeptide (TPR) repeat protein
MSSALSAGSQPLVSIVTRTLGRPTLAEVAACVRDQTHRPLEWIVVDAAGTGLALPSAGDVRAWVVGTGQRLLRSPAANLGLRAASGRLLLILDDDDLILPGHAAGLVGSLAANPQVGVAYADVEVWDRDRHAVGAYAWDYSRLHLCRQNLFPPLAALFDSALVRERGCRMDETLDYFEDWDFWLQAAGHTPFVHLPRSTAIYRGHLSQSGVMAAGTPDADPRCNADLARIIDRYADVRRGEEARRDRVKGRAIDAQTTGNLTAAAALWREAHAIDSADVEVLLRSAGIAVHLKEYAAAADAYQRAARIAPRVPEIHWHHALALNALGRATEAAAARARARTLDPAIGTRGGSGGNATAKP